MERQLFAEIMSELEAVMESDPEAFQRVYERNDGLSVYTGLPMGHPGIAYREIKIFAGMTICLDEYIYMRVGKKEIELSWWRNRRVRRLLRRYEEYQRIKAMRQGLADVRRGQIKRVV